VVSLPPTPSGAGWFFWGIDLIVALGRNIRPGFASYPLTKGLRVGQTEEYADLYRQYLPRILNYIRLRVDGEDLAQDLTAEVFERAVSRQHTLRRREAFAAWLFRIARNTVAGHYRRRRATVPLDQAAEQPATNPSPTEEMMRREELARLTTALATLSEREQEIIRLRFGAELGNKEIAGILRLRAGHVAVILYRALRKLRLHLEEDEG
jgi:RNA polymerase sigma-70 factor (ECF subfamily)